MIKVEDYIDVKKTIEKLGCISPTLVAILPRNFASAKSRDEFIHEDSTLTIRTLWRQSGITETPIEQEAESFSIMTEESFEWVGPLILFTATAITQNPQLVDVSIGVIANYLTDWFKGVRKSEKNAKLDVIVEKENGLYKRIHYEGSPEGLKEIPKIVRSIHDEP